MVCTYQLGGFFRQNIKPFCFLYVFLYIPLTFRSFLSTALKTKLTKHRNTLWQCVSIRVCYQSLHSNKMQILRYCNSWMIAWRTNYFRSWMHHLTGASFSFPYFNGSFMNYYYYYWIMAIWLLFQLLLFLLFLLLVVIEVVILLSLLYRHHR